MRRPLTLATLILALLGLDSSPAASVLAGEEMRYSFDGGSKKAGQRLVSFLNHGEAAVRTRVVTAHGGLALRAHGRTAWAVRLPAFADGSNPPRAVIRVRNATPRDHLEPGGAWFRFGAEFRRNKTSSGSPADNGDNLIQRGRWHSRQFKIELDHRRVTCSVNGSAGRVSVTAATGIRPKHWYRAACKRDGSLLSLRVWHFRDGRKTSSVTTAHGRTGRLEFPDAVPLSIGGKLRADGSLAPSTDQFNGIVDNAFLTIR